MQVIYRQKIVEEIEELKNIYGDDRSSLLPILHAMQDKYQYIPDRILQSVAHALEIHPAEVEAVASFYSFFETREKLGKYVIRLCQTVTCDMKGKHKVARQLQNELGIKFGETTKDGMFSLRYTNCLGLCDQGPAMLVNDRLFAHVTPEKTQRIIEECHRDFIRSEFPRVVPSILRKTGSLLNAETTGAEGLKNALGKKPAEVIEEIRKSNLKGRGGAGFPTAFKWQLAAEDSSETKYVVCNADEGEPGTFKDRFLLYDRTDLILDGMTIGAYAIGASQGFIYLRIEYRYMQKYLEAALEKRRQQGLLGENIAGRKGFNFDIQIRMGAGAYVCGEETALIESLEGERGEPRNRPPFPVDTGFFGRPTIVNNVETFLGAALILTKGAQWFAEHGTDKSKGTKLYSISGDCEKPGIYEFAFGTSINELLIEVGGENAKAVQIGGASGLCISSVEFDRKLSFEDLSSGGSVIIFGPDRDMLQVAKNFSNFFIEESCGQCTPCRIGNIKIREGISLLEKGKCSSSYLKELVKLSDTMRLTSKCGLGQSSGNAFTTIMEGFREEILGKALNSTEGDIS
ncbi:NADH-quinone oxidoreductase subunit NuoE [bacterium]|nr:NADH-quinone oxidoreductase subunit NuoE [bacterium]